MCWCFRGQHAVSGEPCRGWLLLLHWSFLLWGCWWQHDRWVYFCQIICHICCRINLQANSLCWGFEFLKPETIWSSCKAGLPSSHSTRAESSTLPEKAMRVYIYTHIHHLISFPSFLFRLNVFFLSWIANKGITSHSSPRSWSSSTRRTRSSTSKASL